jgi:hypothetical protein
MKTLCFWPFSDSLLGAMVKSESLSLEEYSAALHPVDVSVLCFWLGMTTGRNSISAGLKTVACDCCWSWNSNELKVPEPEVQVPGSVIPTLPRVFPVVCSFRNLCSQLHYNFFAKKYKTLLKFNHVNSHKGF